jgi:hypothetical protein
MSECCCCSSCCCRFLTQQEAVPQHRRGCVSTSGGGMSVDVINLLTTRSLHTSSSKQITAPHGITTAFTARPFEHSCLWSTALFCSCLLTFHIYVTGLHCTDCCMCQPVLPCLPVPCCAMSCGRYLLDRAVVLLLIEQEVAAPPQQQQQQSEPLVQQRLLSVQEGLHMMVRASSPRDPLPWTVAHMCWCAVLPCGLQ